MEYTDTHYNITKLLKIIQLNKQRREKKCEMYEKWNKLKARLLQFRLQFRRRRGRS